MHSGAEFERSAAAQAWSPAEFEPVIEPAVELGTAVEKVTVKIACRVAFVVERQHIVAERGSAQKIERLPLRLELHLVSAKVPHILPHPVLLVAVECACPNAEPDDRKNGRKVKQGRCYRRKEGEPN